MVYLTGKLTPFLVMAGRYEEANRTVDGWLRDVTPSEDPEALFLDHGHMLLELGRADEALALANDVSKRAQTSREDFYAVRIRARALAALGRFDEAEEAATKLRAGPWTAFAKLLALEVNAKVALGRGHPDSALVFLARMRQQGTYYGRMDQGLLEAQARAYVMKGDLQAAAGAYEELLHIYGGNAPARYELGKVYQALGRDREAVAKYRRFLDLWAEADEGLPQLADAKSRLAALTGG